MCGGAQDLFMGMEDLYLGSFLNLMPGAQDLFMGMEDTCILGFF